MYRLAIRDLRRAYDQKVDERDQKKVAEKSALNCFTSNRSPCPARAGSVFNR